MAGGFIFARRAKSKRRYIMKVWNEKSKKYEAEVRWCPEERRYISSAEKSWRLVECSECRNTFHEHDIIGGLCDDCREREYEQRRVRWGNGVSVVINVGSDELGYEDEEAELAMWLEHIASQVERGYVEGFQWKITRNEEDLC